MCCTFCVKKLNLMPVFCPRAARASCIGQRAYSGMPVYQTSGNGHFRAVKVTNARGQKRARADARVITRL